MTINIFAHIGEVKIEDHLFQYNMIANDNKNESFQQFLEDNIPKTCGLINVYCDITMPLDTILDIVSYAHRIGASVSVFTYDCFRLKEFNDWAKVNKYIMYKTHIVF